MDTPTGMVGGVMKVVLVTGSRDWTDINVILAVLNSHEPDLVIHGACPTGADEITAAWAKLTETPCIPMPADWNKSGKRAGPIRNRDMVTMVALMKDYGHNVVVCAFPLPSSNGTINCIKEAEAQFLKVEIHNG